MHVPSPKIRSIVCCLILALLVLTACQAQITTETPPPTLPTAEATASPESAPPTAPDSTPTTGPTPADQESTLPEASPTPHAGTPTPAAVIEDWREAPILPESVSQRVLEIFQSGQAQGRDPHSFSVIGDCQSIPYVFMGPFSRGELSPESSESHLWNAIAHFDASFKRWAVTARGGFTAASILNPLQADQHECKPGETPLSCEFRLNNPAYVLITLETWLDPETIDRYELYLRQILDTVIEKGAIPILLTKADSSELRDGTHIINPVIVKLAYAYDVPVVNFWRAAQYLDNYGIDPEREGFHLSQAGYDLKNILALRALHLVWQTVTETTVQPTDSSPEKSPTPTSTTTPTATQPSRPAVTAPDCQGGCIFFGLVSSREGIVQPQGVFAYQVQTGTLFQVLPEGVDLQDVSEDGQRLLVNQGSRLFEITLRDKTALLISDTFQGQGRQGAYWTAGDEDIVYLDYEDPIQTGTGEAFQLFPAPASETLVVESGVCTAKDDCQSAGIYQIPSDGVPVLMESYAAPVFSPEGASVAFLNPEAATEENYHHIGYLLLEETARGIGSRRVLYLPEEAGFMVYPEVENYAFSPEGKKLLILYNVYSEYYEKSLRLQTYLWNLDNGILYDFGNIEGISGALNPRLVWSPDGEQILFFLTEVTEEAQYQINLFRTDLRTGEKLILADEALLSSTEYPYLTNLYWRE